MKVRRWEADLDERVRVRGCGSGGGGWVTTRGRERDPGEGMKRKWGKCRKICEKLVHGW